VALARVVPGVDGIVSGVLIRRRGLKIAVGNEKYFHAFEKCTPFYIK
jgi:hypothetical protein